MFYLNDIGTVNFDSWDEECLTRKRTRMANLLKIAEPDAESCKAGGFSKIFRGRIIENYTAQLDKDKALLPFTMALFEQDRE